jgi:hypothetical protein
MLEEKMLCIDTELLLHARKAFLDNDPQKGCGRLLLLLERCMLKEQLAAGLLQQQQALEPAGPASSSDAATAAAAAAASDDSAASWSKVRPLPPDVSLQLLETTAAAALIGLGAAYGGSGLGSYLLLPETARNQLLDPVLVPPGNLPALRFMWAHLGSSGLRRLVNLPSTSNAKSGASEVLGRCLRVAYHLAAANWRIQLQQQQSAKAAAAAHVAEQAGAAAESEDVVAAAAAAASVQLTNVPLVFSEHLATLAAADFDTLQLYPQQQQQQNSAAAAVDKPLGAFTQAAMPMLAARCALLLACVIGSLGVLESSLPGGAGGAKAAGPLHGLLLPAVAAAQQMTALAADLLERQQQQQQEEKDGEGKAAAAATGKQRQQQHWLIAALQPLQRLLNKLAPSETASSAAAGGVVTRSKAAAAAASADSDKRVVQMRDWCAALLALAKPLGVELLQVRRQHLHWLG